MTKAFAEELVWAESEDGMRLDGAVVRPSECRHRSNTAPTRRPESPRNRLPRCPAPA